MMNATKKAAHKHADQKRMDYCAKFKRPVSERAANNVYHAAFRSFLLRAAA